MPKSTSPNLHPVDAAAFNVLSYNVWGMFNAKDNEKRLRHMAEKKLHQFDIICLQECFGEGDFKTIEAVLKNHNFNCIRVTSAPVGPGLALFTRFPVLSHTFFRFPIKGIAEKIHHGDYYSNKGVTVSRLKVPCCKNSLGTSTTNLVVYNTHLIAQYEKYSKLKTYEAETYSAVRLSEIAFIASVITSTSNPVDDNILICGDFNAGPQSPEMMLLSALVERYALKQLHHMEAVDPSIHIGDGSNPAALIKALPTDTATKSNTTYSLENVYNSSSTSYFQLLDLVEDLPAQLDHIIYRPAFGRVTAASAVEAVETKLTLLPFIPPHNADIDDEYRVDESDIRACFQGDICHNVAQAVVVFDSNTEVPEINHPMSDHWGVAARFVMTNVAAPGGLVSGPKDKMDFFGRTTFTIDAKELVEKLSGFTADREEMHQFTIRYATGIISRSHIRNLREFKSMMYYAAGIAIGAPFAICAAASYDPLGMLGWLPTNFLCTMCGLVGLSTFIIGYVQRQYDAITMADVRDGLVRAADKP